MKKLAIVSLLFVLSLCIWGGTATACSWDSNCQAQSHTQAEAIIWEQLYGSPTFSEVTTARTACASASSVSAEAYEEADEECDNCDCQGCVDLYNTTEGYQGTGVDYWEEGNEKRKLGIDLFYEMACMTADPVIDGEWWEWSEFTQDELEDAYYHVQIDYYDALGWAKTKYDLGKIVFDACADTAEDWFDHCDHTCHAIIVWIKSFFV